MQSHYSLNDVTKSVKKDSTGEELHVNCYDDLKPYYAYVCSKDSAKAGQQMLRNVFNGEKVIKNMIENAQQGY